MIGLDSLVEFGPRGLGRPGQHGQFERVRGIHFLGEPLTHLGILLEEAARILPALTDALAAVGVPGAALLDDPVLGGAGDEAADDVG